MAKKNNRSKKRQKTPAQLAQAQQAKIDKKKRTVRKYILVGVAVAVVLAAVIVAVVFTQQNKPASENDTQTNTAETDATAQTDHTHADDENHSGVAQNGEQNSTENGQSGSSSSNDTSDATENAEEELEQAVDHYAQAHEMPQQVQAVVQQIQSNPPTQTPSGQAMTPGSEDLLYWTHDVDLLHGAQYLVVYDTGVYQNENGVKCYVQAEYYLYEDETSYATGKETFYNEETVSDDHTLQIIVYRDNIMCTTAQRNAALGHVIS